MNIIHNLLEAYLCGIHSIRYAVKPKLFPTYEYSIFIFHAADADQQPTLLYGRTEKFSPIIDIKFKINLFHYTHSFLPKGGHPEAYCMYPSILVCINQDKLRPELDTNDGTTNEPTTTFHSVPGVHKNCWKLSSQSKQGDKLGIDVYGDVLCLLPAAMNVRVVFADVLFSVGSLLIEE